MLIIELQSSYVAYSRSRLSDLKVELEVPSALISDLILALCPHDQTLWYKTRRPASNSLNHQAGVDSLRLEDDEEGNEGRGEEGGGGGGGPGMSTGGPAAWDVEQVATWMAAIEGVDPAVTEAIRDNELASRRELQPLTVRRAHMCVPG